MTNSAIWTVQDVLQWTTGYFESKGVDSPRRNAELLVGHFAQLSRMELYTQFDRPLTPEERQAIGEAVKARGKGEPLQYVLGEAPFRHITLKVAPGVLIPRPETEILVDEVIAAIKELGLEAPRILDAGTGSGCIALALADELEGAVIVATDISEDALSIARGNAEELGLSERVTFLKANFAEPALTEKFDVIVSNPPYIPSSNLLELPTEVADFEPSIALDGGSDGLDALGVLLEQAVVAQRVNGRVLLAVELDERNVTQAQELALKLGMFTNVAVKLDLTGRQRFLLCSS